MVCTKTLVFFCIASLFASGTLGARFLNFDASLLLGVDPYSLERLQNINYELALLSLTDLAVHADAVCLQGYYLPYQVASLQSILSPYLPYSYSATPNTGLCFCNQSEIVSLSVCLAQNCSSLTTSSQQLLCGFKCLSAYLPYMSTICQGCITGQFNGLVAGTTNISNALTQCVVNSYAGDSGSACAPYGGYSGNVLFSRYPLKNATTQSLVYPGVNNLFNSDAIMAVSSFPGLGDVNLVCTQLQPTGPLTTAQALSLGPINGYQTQTLLTLIETAVASSSSKQVAVMGNFKQSPNITSAGVEAINSGYYALWQGYGYEDLISSTPQCTYCATNALITASYLANSMSSHIFVRSFSSNTNLLSMESEITLNTTTTILDLTGAYYGQAVTVPYSPNYGVVVQFNTVTTTGSSAASLTLGSWWLCALRSAASLVLSA